MRRTALIISMCAIVALMASCRTLRRTVERPVYIHDTTMIRDVIKDSIYIDRLHEILRDGDTVRIHDSVLVYRYICKTDTAIVYREKPVTVTEYVEVSKLTWWQQTQIRGFWLLLILICGYVAVRCFVSYFFKKSP